jgi:hypothetical protein
LKRTHRIGIAVLLIVSCALAVSAQDSNQSLGDLARQQRKEKQAGNSGQTDSNETSGLKDGIFKANILIAESHDAIEKWVLTPETGRAGTGRIRQAIVDKKYYLPFVVTEYPWPVSEKMYLTAHVRLISPAGKTVFAAAKFSEALAPDPRSPNVIVLNPVMDLTLDTDDLPGTYTIRVTVTDHVHSTYAKAEEQFQLIRETSTEGEAAKTPATVR